MIAIKNAINGASMLQFSVQYGVDFPAVSRQQLRAWALRAVQGAAQYYDFDRAELTLRLVDPEEAQALNRDYRQKDYVPNVLTFEYGVDPEGMARGDIVICVDVLQKEAQAQRKTLRQHMAHLLVHGVLHALGFDHQEEADAEAMESLEIALLADMGFPNPYTSN